MSNVIALTEYRDSSVLLRPEDATFIQEQARGRIQIRRALSGVEYVLNTQQFVGMVTLPSNIVLECAPKVPVSNLFHMLSVAYDLPDPFLDGGAYLDTMDEVIAIIAERFATMVEDRISRGLYRSYVEEEGNLTSVRGRILVSEDIRKNHILRHRTYCRFSEYSWDVPENRVLRQVVRVLGRFGFASRGLRHRLNALDGVLEDVSPGHFTAADLDRFQYNRLNDDYRPLHNLCRLILDGVSPSGGPGAYAFDAFLLDMNRLFEGFVTTLLGSRTPPSMSVLAQVPTSLDTAGKVAIRPDLTVQHHGSTVLVADCKYKRHIAGVPIHHDLYQMLAYCTALRTHRGVLIYPQSEVPLHELRHIRNSEVSISGLSIDLAGDLAMLKAASDTLVEQFFALAAESTHRHQEQGNRLEYATP